MFAYTKPEPRDGRAGPPPEYPYPTSLFLSLSLSLFLSILWNTRLEHAAAKTKPRLPLLTKQ